MSGSKFFLLATLALISPFAYADSPVTITEIASTSTPMPGSTGDFTEFGIPSGDRDNITGSRLSPTDYYSSSDVFFTAQGADGFSGIYVATFPAPGITEISTIADTTMTAATGGTFASFSNTSSGQYEAGFIANDSNGVQGVYAFDPYGLHLIASSNTSPAPGSTFGNFQSISFISEGPDRYTGAGEIESQTGIYSYVSDFAPSFALVANNSTIPPGASTPFTSFGPVSYKAGVPASNAPGYQAPRAAMLATVAGVPGIYISVGTNLGKLVDTASAVPGGAGNFTSFGNPITTSTYIEFTANYDNGSQQGVFAYGPYMNQGDVPKLLEFVASGTLAPDSNGAHFASFLSLGNNQAGNGQTGLPTDETQDIPFLAMLDDGVEGIYCTTGIGTSVKILDTGDILDGKTVSSLELSPDSSGLAFTTFEVGFTDNSSGIYYFDTNVLPEPATLGLLAFPMLLFMRRR